MSETICARTIDTVERIVTHLHKEGHARGMHHQDAVSVALLGLAEADSRYDRRHGASRWTFAAHRIRGAVIDAARKEARAWSPLNPAANGEHCRPCGGVGAQLMWPTGRPDLSDFQLPVNSPIEARSFESRLNAREMSRLLGRCLRNLPARRRHMVLEVGLKGRSARDAGKQIGLSRGRAQRFLEKGLRDIREALQQEGYSLEDFL